MRLLAAVIFAIVSIGYCAGETLTDYIVNESDKHAYKIMYKGENWETARDNCEKEDAKLAVPKTKDEFDFIQKVVRGMQYNELIGVKYRYLVWVGVNNLEDYKVWKNVDGEDIKATGFSTWASNYTENSRPEPEEPHCAGVDAINPGLREFWCHHVQPYLCEKIVK